MCGVCLWTQLVTVRVTKNILTKPLCFIGPTWNSSCLTSQHVITCTKIIKNTNYRLVGKVASSASNIICLQLSHVDESHISLYSCVICYCVILGLFSWMWSLQFGMVLKVIQFQCLWWMGDLDHPLILHIVGHSISLLNLEAHVVLQKRWATANWLTC